MGKPKTTSTTIKTAKKPSSNQDMGLWSSLQSLSNAPKEANERQYVHPLCRRSQKLSQKSLELCTENLGSETGSDHTMEISILSSTNPKSTPKSSSLSSMEEEEEEEAKLPRQMDTMRNKVVSRNFPPPLTTIRSSNSLQVRPHRKDGRLIIQAIETPSRNTYLQAERSNGRLRLSFFNDSAADSISSGSENQERDNIEEEEEEEEEDNINEYESDINDDDCYYQEDEQLQEFDVINNMDEFHHQRPSRCKEGGHHGNNKGLCNWKPLWVATS